jgi:manganese-dependent inorganic pyrophosphatase
VETVGETLHERQAERIEALRAVRERDGHAVVALMVTDIMAKGSTLYAAADRAVLDHAFGRHGDDGVVELPGVMSRKKQVAPKLLTALAAR